MTKKISLYVMSFFYVMAGFNHFMNPEFYLEMIPPYLPSPLIINAVAGVAEMILGMMLVRPAVRSLSAWGIILLLIAIFPANLYMAQVGGAVYGVPDWSLWLRLPLQLVLLAWAFWHTKNPDVDTQVIETEIEIAASPDKVWKILTDTDRYADWNPFIISAAGGPPALGKKMRIAVQQPDGTKFQFQNTIIEFQPKQIFAWRGSFIVRGLFDGVHYFRLENRGEGRTHLLHGEKFEGILVGTLSMLLGNTKDGFVLMNEALKERAEKAR